MKLTFCGAAGTTTGSQHLLEINGSKILLDCGLYQGRRDDTWDRNRNFLYDPESIDSVVLSHAHIDHSGNLPNLTRNGFEGNIYATFATRDLCSIMLPDAARIQTQDTKWINKRRKKKDLPPVEPIYSEVEAEECLRQFVNIGYDRPIPIADGVTLRFIDAGHILGSAQVLLECREGSKKKTFLFSGDVGRGDNELLRDPVLADDVDFLLMESTYGAREHELPTQANHLIRDILNRALEKKGKVIIPAFAVERTQQLIYVLHELSDNGEIPDVPIFVDSPLAVNATEIFRIHPECFNEEVYDFLFAKRNPFGFENLTMVRKVSESKKLNEMDGPCIIISASGMCEAGRILHHLRNTVEDEKNTILFVGYCAEQTLGWKLREGWEEVNIFGDPFKVRANIEILDSFSGHADQSELLEYFKGMGGARDNVWLVHGEPTQSAGLKEALDGFHKGDVEVAKWKHTVEF
ncbi:MAG: MBL fold metallo-hydrolase [Verrucomicrobiales bacterium]|nr:MBL fold metallo-hydrolase [Verrucomicrobiales bacterium]